METTGIKSNIRNGIDIFNDIDLEEVLDVAKTIVEFLPHPIDTAINLIIKVLEYLIKMQPAVKKITKSVDKISDSVQALPQAQAPTPSKSDVMTAFENLVDIAKSDGVVTDEEEAFLWSRAQKIGISKTEFKRMIQI